MKITDVKPYLCYPGTGKNWLFVRIATDEGIVGWGECYTQLDRDSAILGHIEQLERYLIGRDPFNIKHFSYVAYHDFAKKRGSMDFFSAMSGIEMALWDIVGKAVNKPVYKLLGGACREKIRIYANGWYYNCPDIGEMAERALKLVDKGFTALKFDPLPNPWRLHISREEEQAAVNCVKAIRMAVGPKIDLLIECHRRLAPYNALRLAKRLEEFEPFWFEEPVSCKNIDALASVADRTDLAIVTGEELYTKIEFREVFEKQAANIINPDVCCCGGILELKEIAAMAEAYFVAVAPHNYNSTTLGLAATVQAAAVMPNFLITEYFYNFEAPGKEASVEPLDVRDGYVYLNDRPGLGIDLDEKILEKMAPRQFPLRHVRQFNEEP